MRNLDFQFGFYGERGFALSSTIWKVESVSILISFLKLRLRFKRKKKTKEEEEERMIVAVIGINAKYFM